MKWKWANFPVPAQHLAGLILGGLVQARSEQPLLSNPLIYILAGWALVVTGIAIAVWSVITVGEVDIEASQQLLTDGPYARSRNPMMGAWTLFYLGVGLVLNSVWILAVLPLVILFTHFFDVLREERLLADKFGEEYLQYRGRVRRYF